MSDALIMRARKFFDRQKLRGQNDPEMDKFFSRLQAQVDVARGDRGFQGSIVRTLAVLERDIRARQDRLHQQLVTKLKDQGKTMSAEDMSAEVMRSIPRELRYLQASGLSLVQALSSNSKMTEKELRKVTERMQKFSEGVDTLRTEGKGGRSYAQDRDGTGVSLTDRLRQYREGKLADTQRHKELLEKLDETAEKDDKAEDRKTELRKLGLTALLGPAAPLFQLWTEAKDDIKKLRGDAAESLEATKKKFKWDRDRDDTEVKIERKQTSLFERMLKAMKMQELGQKAKGLKGWLFGDDDDDGIGRKGPRWWRRAKIAARRGGRVLGRTARGIRGALGRGAGALGRGAGVLGRGALALGGSSLGGVAAGGAASMLGAAGLVGAAGYAGWKAGGYIYDNMLSEEQKEAIGKAIYDGVEWVSKAASSVGSALQSAGSGIANFFSDAGKKTKDAFEDARETLVRKTADGMMWVDTQLKSAATTLEKWTSDAQANLRNFWGTLSQAPAAVAGAAKTVVRNVQDFVVPQSGGAKISSADKSAGERARERVSAAVDKGKGIFGSGSKEVQAVLEQQMTAAGITNPRERAMFLAQMSHESAGFKTLEESFRYRDPSRIASLNGQAKRAGLPAIQSAMDKGPEAIAELMYGGRKDLGNTEQGDGFKFRGRGVIQLTGRANYQKYGEKLGIDLVNNPDLAKDPEIAARIATEYWKDRKLGAAAQAGNVEAVTQGINGGRNGLADRQNLYAQFLRGQDPSLALSTAGTSMAGAGQSTWGAAVFDPRRVDVPRGIAGVSPTAPAAYSRVSPQTQVPPVPAMPGRPGGPASTGSVQRMGMDRHDFYIDDLGLILMNRGLGEG